MKVVLKMTDVSKVYPGGSVALQNVDIHIEPGEFVFVVGPSGAGKSTFIKMLFREVLPTTGSIFVNGVDILSLTPNEIPYMRRQLGIIFQDYRLLPDRTVYENVAFAMEVIETPRRKIKRRVLNVLDLVGLRHRADAYPNELSGGEQQRIAIARALLNHPKVIIADEPTGNLDPDTAEKIVGLLYEISHTGTPVVISTHNHGLIDRFPGRVYKCEEGKLIEMTDKTNKENNK